MTQLSFAPATETSKAAATKKANHAGNKVKQLLSSAAILIAATAMGVSAPTPATAAEQTASVEQAMDAAFESLIAESKANMMRDPAEAFKLASDAENMVLTSATYAGAEHALATAQWLKGEALVRSGKPEEGAEVIAEAILNLGEENLETKLGGDLLLAQGRVAGRLSDTNLAAASFFKAHDVFVTLDEPRSEAMSLMQIGSLYRDAQAYDKALTYYERAAEIYSDDASLDLSSANNQGNILKEMGRYAAARVFFSKALSIAEKMDSPVLQARILTNVAEMEGLAGDYSTSEAVAGQALGHLEGDAGTEWARFIFGVQAYAKLKTGDVASAVALVDEALENVDAETSSLNYRELHNVAYQTYVMNGDFGNALTHHEAFKRLNDEATKIAASANGALLGAQFNATEQKLNIERLKNDQMQKDILLESANRQLTAQLAVMAVGGLVILFFFLSLVGLRKHRKEITQSNKKLRSTVDLLNEEIGRREIVERDLVEAKEVAEQASRMKSTFLATMSHELRTPMNGILGFSKVLLGGDLTNEQREQIEIIKNSGQSLLALINDVLDISQIEAGKMKLNSAPFNLRETVEDSVALLKPKAQEKGLDLAVHVDPELATIVEGDSARIRQIIVNLVGNAIKFTEDGSVAAVVTAGEGENDVKVAVIDTGIGIAKDKQEILFDRFSQVDDSLARKHEGTGLGLAISKELVEAMGGAIGVASELGEGSEFWASIPLAAAEDMPVLRGDKKLRFEEQKRIVLVDDNQVNQRVFDVMMTAMNVETHICGNAEIAFQKLYDLHNSGAFVDAVIVAQTLPDVRAETLVKRVDRNGLCSHAKIFLSGPQAVDFDTLRMQGFDGQIDQPITSAALFSELRLLVENTQDETVEPQAPQQVADVVTLARPKCSGRVLVAEDNASNQQLITACLKAIDVEIDAVRNGVEAVEAAQDTAYDLILMDIHMPTLDGVEAMRRIRRLDGPNANTPIVALTAFALPGDREKFLEAGMDDYVAKPIDIDALHSKVRTLLERRNKGDAAKVEKNEDNVVRLS